MDEKDKMPMQKIRQLLKLSAILIFLFALLAGGLANSICLECTAIDQAQRGVRRD